MERLACYKCGQCNKKGKPSVMRYSKYCDTHYTGRDITKTKKGLFSIFTDVKNKFWDKRVQYNKDGTMKKLESKGFRKSWFWR